MTGSVLFALSKKRKNDRIKAVERPRVTKMIALIHFVGGAAIATTNNNPLAAFFLGVVSHFVIDIIPHHNLRSLLPWTYRKDKKTLWSRSWPLKVHLFSFLNLTGLVLFSFYFLTTNHTTLLIGGIGGVFPDFYEWFAYYFRSLPTLHFWHNEKSKSLDNLWGVLVQALLLFFFLSIIFSAS